MAFYFVNDYHVGMMQDAIAEKKNKKHEKVCRYICNEIIEGRLKPKDRLDSPEQIAKNLRLEASTVRYALQQLASGGVLVRRRRAGSFISDDARALAMGWMLPFSSINVIIPSDPLPEGMACLQGIQSEAANNNITVTISSIHMGQKQLDKVITEQIDSGVGGFIVMTAMNQPISTQTIARIHESQLPVVCCQGSILGLDAHSISPDNVANMEKVLAHLLEIGRKKIAFVGFEDPKHPMIFKASHYDFLSILQKFGISPDFNRKIAITIPKSRETIFDESAHWYEMIETFLKKYDDTDALCCHFDRIAWAAIRAVKDMGKMVPEDIAVTGAGLLNPYYGMPTDELTTVGICAEEVGRKACRILLDICAGKLPKTLMETKLPGTLLIGRSTVGKQR